MALKTGPVWSVVSGEPADSELADVHLDALDQYHGLPNGMFSCSELLAGKNTSQGTETCTVVETLFSLQCAMAITGGAKWGDRIEKIAYNALPAPMNDVMKAHQYLQLPNQIEASGQVTGLYSNNKPTANLFGLQPQYFCCTCNFHQGWPKLVQSLWMATTYAGENDGLAATVFGPCTVDTQVGGTQVSIKETTDYPFENTIRMTVTPANAVSFPLRLRAPAWADTVKVAVNGVAQTAGAVDGFVRIDRKWSGTTTIDIEFVSDPRIVTDPYHDDAITFEYGSLVFALPMPSVKKSVPGGNTSLTLPDPEPVWAYAVDPHGALTANSLRTVKSWDQEVPFASDAFGTSKPIVTLTVEGAREAPGWTMSKSGRYATDVPAGVPVSEAGDATETLTLVPYGTAKLRITSFPPLTT